MIGNAAVNLVTFSVELVFLKFSCCGTEEHEENSSVCAQAEFMVQRVLFIDTEIE